MFREKADKSDLQHKATSLMRLFIIISISLFLFIFIGGSIAFVFSMRQIIRTNKGSELSQMLEMERLKLEASVNNEIAIALKMAGSPLVQEYFANPGDPEIIRIASAEIAAYRVAFSSNSIFWINDIDKMFYSDDNEPYFVDAENPDNYWYRMTLYETEVYNFNINYNPDLRVTNL
ncbi:MAG: methyl-accepting chemotaxis protein, partial [Treponema sp.]|nr:methyl-accepting chemotaxis protein [Treponema sp.]